MAISTIGVSRGADPNVDDISVYYSYSPNRETIGDTIYPLNATDLITETHLPDTEAIVGNENILEGLYNMKLPASIFNQLGIYTIYIKPKSFPVTIMDCNVISSLPTIKGIVLNINDLPTKLQSNNALQSYRIEYIGTDGKKIRNLVRYVVTANKVVPVNENIGNTSQRSTRYRFDEGNLIFLQLTPSSSSDVKPNVIPFIGNPGQTITITNTYFTPLTIEVEMVENTLDTIADIVGGEQIKDVQNGKLTYFDKDRVITKQFDLYEIKNDPSDVPLYEVKEKSTTIDDTQNFDNVTSGI